MQLAHAHCELWNSRSHLRRAPGLTRYRLHHEQVLRGIREHHGRGETSPRGGPVRRVFLLDLEIEVGVPPSNTRYPFIPLPANSPERVTRTAGDVLHLCVRERAAERSLEGTTHLGRTAQAGRLRRHARNPATAMPR